VGSPTELTPSDSRLKDWQFTNVDMDGDVLFATTMTGDPSQAVAVNLGSGNIARLENSLALNKQWPTTQRYFAWIEFSKDGMSNNLYAYDLAAGKKLAIAGEGGFQSSPDVSGDMVVWSEVHGDRSWDIYAYSIASDQLIAAVTRSGIQSLPKIDGDWVVYLEVTTTDPRNMTADVYLHNLTTGEDSLLGTSPYASEGGTYGIAHGRIVWLGWTPDELKQQSWPPPFHVYDLPTRTDHLIDASSPCIPTEFFMAGDLIMYGCQEGFYGYDLAKDALFRIPNPRGVGAIYFSETRVVFQIEVESPRTFLTPGAPTSTPGPYVPQPMKFRLFVEPINRLQQTK
jgi:beta propeller repeat protein